MTLSGKPIAILCAVLTCVPPCSAQEKAPAPDPATAHTPAPGHWPQWRGPNRDNVSTETGLLKEWPPGGPKLLWKKEGLGDGIGSVSVAGGLVFLQGYRDGDEYVTALDGAGSLAWCTRIGPASGESVFMRFVTIRAPTVDEDRVYALSWQGMLYCLSSAEGKILWKKSYVGDFLSENPPWAFSDSPLVDGELLVCAPGGSAGTLAALDKRTGKVVWRSAKLKDRWIHAAILPAELGGVRQYIVFTYDSVSGIVAKTGALAWRAERPGTTAVVPTPIVYDGFVLVASGYGVGANAFRVTLKDGQFSVRESWSGNQLQIMSGGMVRLGEYVYALSDHGCLKCLEFKTGKETWADRSVGKGSILAVGDRLICRGEGGGVALVESNPHEYKECGLFNPMTAVRGDARSQPVMAGGRLYLRADGILQCYDVRGTDYKEPPKVWEIPFKPPPVQKTPSTVQRTPPLPVPRGEDPPPAFVPTPEDVVEKMIELAKVTKDDVLYDLGSGDGRIVLTAARNKGCKSVGFEINPGLVWVSQFKAKQQKLDELVTIEEKDLFTADLSTATVITLYLGETNNARLLPQLAKLKPGTRIVSHAHQLGPAGPKPEKSITMISKETGSEHTLYLWTLPFKPSSEEK